MKSSTRNSDARKRRRSSIENEIMKQRLEAWRAKKENRKLPLKHTTPRRPLKSTLNPNKECNIQSSSKPQQAPLKSHDQSHDLPNLIRGRKSVRSCSPKISSAAVESVCDVNTPTISSATPGPSNRKQTMNTLSSNKECKIQSSSKPQQAPIKSHDQSHDLPNLIQGRKSVRFCSPKISSAAVESVCDVNTPTISNATPGPSNSKQTMNTLNPNKECKIQSSSKPQQAPLKSHDQSCDLLNLIPDRKSVRFCSPKISSVESVCDVNTPTVSNATPGPSNSKQTMKERLAQWLVSKGKTPSRFQNFLGYESSLHHTRAGGFYRRRSGTPHIGRNRRDTLGRETSGSDEGPVRSTMKECLEMLEEGSSLEDMSAWLDGMVTKVPPIQQCAGYWLCRAKIAEKQGGDQSAIECLFEAVQFNPEPVKDILDTLATYRLKLKLSNEESETSASSETGLGSALRHTPCLEVQTPIARLSFGEEDGNQSPDERDLGGDTSHLSIKFSLKETTPYMARIHETNGHSPSTPCLLVTPVRRSARLDNKRRSVACLGSQLTCNLAVTECLDSLGDVAATYPKAQLILRPNRALTEEFSEAGLGP